MHAAGDLGEQHLARLEIGQLSDFIGGHELAVQHPALDHELRICPREIAQTFGHDDGITSMKAIAVGPTRCSSIPSTPASRAAIVVSVFFDTA